MLNKLIDIDELLKRQQDEIELWHSKPIVEFVSASFIDDSTLLNHFNFSLWHEEDIARVIDIPDDAIAKVKRAIDKYNQKRNDRIEIIDEYLTSQLTDVKIKQDARLNSETAGSIIDRLSINALKIFHMNEETQRSDATDAHKLKCSDKLTILLVQREDLAACLDELLHDLEIGEKYLKVYRQMKMYNDPTLNPMLYRKKN